MYHFIEVVHLSYERAHVEVVLSSAQNGRNGLMPAKYVHDLDGEVGARSSMNENETSPQRRQADMGRVSLYDACSLQGNEPLLY